MNIKVPDYLIGQSHCFHVDLLRAVARALIGGGGGVYIHIFVLCPTDFF